MLARFKEEDDSGRAVQTKAEEVSDKARRGATELGEVRRQACPHSLQHPLGCAHGTARSAHVTSAAGRVACPPHCGLCLWRVQKLRTAGQETSTGNGATAPETLPKSTSEFLKEAGRKPQYDENEPQVRAAGSVDSVMHRIVHASLPLLH